MRNCAVVHEGQTLAILEEKGNDGQNLIAVMELYAPRVYPGKNQRRNHVLITIYEKYSLSFKRNPGAICWHEPTNNVRKMLTNYE